jgi:hypothetical protein
MWRALADRMASNNTEEGSAPLFCRTIGTSERRAHTSSCSTADTFRGLARLRGVECGSPTRFAEAFHSRKTVLGLKGPAGPASPATPADGTTEAQGSRA